MQLQAPAKINLHLKVMEKTDSGFHRVQTLMVKVGIYDELNINVDKNSQSNDIRISVPGFEAIEGMQNILFKAATAFQNASLLRFGLNVTLIKNIPMGAGLGGGSSDAAILLRGLNAFWDNPLSDQGLFDVGVKLGSDVGFFMTSQDWAVCGDFGNTLISQGTIDRLPLVVCFPNKHLSTLEMYKRLARPLTWDQGDDIHARSFHAQAWEDLRMVLPFENDFEAVVSENWFQEIKQAFLESGSLHAGLSGSGSAVFGLYDTPKQAKVGSESLKSFGKIFVTQT